ncbi:MAG: formylglycine-generating enzyme family protein [Dysgonamonadaceae bacterium]|jgi:formylglycine-generating enzyme required for sulfatase activity|nr:formylglycine-generating enzyme family protein [Dysgonamonadaceae bacterium]
MKQILLTMTAFFMLSAAGAKAQATIGELKDPESFSILELVSTDRGLRLPQLDTDQRDALVSVFAGHEAEALGLQIFNTDTECVETWNGVEWIQTCYNNTPTPPSAPLSAVSCGITNVSATVFTAIADPYAVKYEFLVNGISQSKQRSNVIDFKSPRKPGDITVKYYYPISFLKPKMVKVKGSGGSQWKYGSLTTQNPYTNAIIPDLQWAETEITQAQFEYVFPDRAGVNNNYVNNLPSDNNFRCGTNTIYAPSSAKPAEMINWYDAIAYCNKLSAMEGKTPCYDVSGVDKWLELKYTDIPSTTNTDWNDAPCNFAADGYRLPTEWEWEYVARGGTANTSPAYSGSSYNNINDNADTALDTVGWYNDNSSSQTHNVRGKVANSFGLYDMSGNVWEWCWNFRDAPGDLGTANTPFSTPTESVVSTSNTNNTSRILRGSSWGGTTTTTLASPINASAPYNRTKYNGFRVVCR